MDALKNNRQLPSTLVPGKVAQEYFLLLATVCTLRSESMRNALEDVLVNGLPRQKACEKHSVSQSYFSVKYHHMQTVNRTIALMYSSGLLNASTQQ
ncbi:MULTISPECIES: PapB/FocB family fimbrial expression transcriptional regulator [unclassified Serratia (in: enterobacteria)]|uniref:PapB/FocB family fimbrial expression transcriptional regulator n=1 Tax=Serratia TaxID=613 RepID=UPI0006884B79|nr:MULTISPECIES: PapB/FocB family fimbrial expression transcriptional regulator [unclassified Serratia (in: enterobacteria)]UAN56709.1 transcriptional regulator [Serratia sp. JSRIV004]UAN62305.1 transcriptional regulator [Serratia sp. JSRIV006]